jgi:hypothetical protein
LKTHYKIAVISVISLVITFAYFYKEKTEKTVLQSDYVKIQPSVSGIKGEQKSAGSSSKEPDVTVKTDEKNSGDERNLAIQFDTWDITPDFISRHQITPDESTDIKESLLIMKAKFNELELNNLLVEELTGGQTNFRIKPFPEEGKQLIQSFWKQLSAVLPKNPQAVAELKRGVIALGTEERYDFGGQETVFTLRQNSFSKGYVVEQASFSGEEIVTLGIADPRPIGTEVLNKRFSFTSLPDRFLHLFEKPVK